MEHFLIEKFVSVIIPTYNDPEGLSKCLNALAYQTYPNSLYEIIVIDNGSDRSIEPIVNKFAQVRLIHESSPGSYSARNKGILCAKGFVTAFTDSDAIPEINWLENGIRLFNSTPNCGFVAGKIDVFPKDPYKPNAVERYEKIVSHRQKDYVEKHQFGATANLFSSKRIFKKVGLFDAKLKSRGDLEWGQRVVKYGFDSVYTEEAIVRHPARRTLIELFWRNVRLAGGRIDQRRQSNFPPISPRYLANLILPPLKEIISTISLNKNINKIQHKISLLAIILFVHYVASLETLRMLMGCKSLR